MSTKLFQGEQTARDKMGSSGGIETKIFPANIYQPRKTSLSNYNVKLLRDDLFTTIGGFELSFSALKDVYPFYYY